MRETSDSNRRRKMMSERAERVDDVDVDDMPRLTEMVSPARVRDEMVEEEPRVLALCDSARAMTVTDERSRAKATNILGLMKQRLDVLEMKRKEKSGPFDSAAKAINRVYKLVTSPLKTEYDALKQRLGSYVLAVEQERERALAVQRDEEQRVQKAATRE